MRPKHWVKNGFVFTGVLFGEMANRGEMMVLASLAALSFCFISSAVYVFNDLLDADEDRNHVFKKLRPIASGEIGPRLAKWGIGILVLLSLGIGAFVSPLHLGFVLLYVIINLLYTTKLKEMVIVDVFCIAAGFMLRIFSGTAGIGISPSHWLVLCGLMGTLFLGFSKRKGEILHLKGNLEGHREVLATYNSIFLDELIGITAALAIMSYSLYTMSDETVRIHHTENLIYTVPFVMFALFRYLFLTHTKIGETIDLLLDKQILISVTLFTLFSLFLMKV